MSWLLWIVLQLTYTFEVSFSVPLQNKCTDPEGRSVNYPKSFVKLWKILFNPPQKLNNWNLTLRNFKSISYTWHLEVSQACIDVISKICRLLVARLWSGFCPLPVYCFYVCFSDGNFHDGRAQSMSQPVPLQFHCVLTVHFILQFKKGILFLISVLQTVGPRIQYRCHL